MKENERSLIVDGRGRVERVPYPVENQLILPKGSTRPEITTYEEGLEWNKQAQEHSKKALEFCQDYAKVGINLHGEKAWLINVSDVHWGHFDTDYDHVDKLFKIIETTPDTFAVIGWNLLDAAIPAQFPDGVMWSGQTAQEQVYTFHDKLKTLYDAHKLLGGIGEASCHEGWMRKKAGWAIYRELFSGMDDIPLLYNGGYMEVGIDNQTYRMALFHQIKYWSQFNKTHGGERAMDRLTDAEIVFTSHLHQAATGETNRYNPPFNKRTAVVSSGTCKLHDRWARGFMGKEGEKSGQGIILWRDKHQFQTVYEMDIGHELMRDSAYGLSP